MPITKPEHRRLIEAGPGRRPHQWTTRNVQLDEARLVDTDAFLDHYHLTDGDTLVRNLRVQIERDSVNGGFFERWESDDASAVMMARAGRI